MVEFSKEAGVRAFIEDALDDLLSQPWMEVPKADGIPPWAGLEAVADLVADYRKSLRDMQLKWLYETLVSGGLVAPPTPEQAAFCNGRIQVAEAIRSDLLLILDYAKGGPSDG